MRLKRLFCVLLVCVMTASGFCINVNAMEETKPGVDMIVTRASGKFNMDVKANTAVRASTSFPLDVGETVTIKASYSPFSADVDFGVIAPDGLFYSVNVTDGSVDWSLEVNQRGNYTLAVRNNSFFAINVSGYVNY